MKAPWIVCVALLAACGLGTGAMWWSDAMRMAALADQVAQLKNENGKLAAEAASATERARALESESAQLRAVSASSGPRLEPPQPPPPPVGDPRLAKQDGLFGKLFKDPAMRKMMAAQQAGALRGFYAAFVKEANLTPEEADHFFQLLQDRQMALMDSSANLMSGGGVDMKAATAATEAANDAIKELLGPDRYGLYQAFEKTLGARIQVQQFNNGLGAEGGPLQDYQSQALIQIMSEEKATLPSFQSATGASPQTALNMSPADIDQYSRQVAAMNQRVYQRAMSVLTPPQLSAFAAFQQNMATAQIAGLKMTQQMLKVGQ